MVLGFFQVVLDGFVVFVVNAVGSGLFFLLFRDVIRRRVSEWLQAELSGYIREQLEFTISHADETAKALKPVIVAIMNEVLKDYEKGQGEGMVEIPFLGRVPGSLVQAFVERFLGGSKVKSSEGGNPFE